MLEINLIRENLSLSKAREKSLRLWNTLRKTIMAIFILLVFAAGYLHIRITELKREKNEYLSAIENGRNMYNISQMEGEWAEYVRGLSAIDWYMNSRSQWSLRLAELSSVMPGNVYISSLESSIMQDTGKIAMTAVGVVDKKQEGNIVNEFINVLNKTIYFSNQVKMDSDERSKLGEKEIEAFSVSMNDSPAK